LGPKFSSLEAADLLTFSDAFLSWVEYSMHLAKATRLELLLLVFTTY